MYQTARPEAIPKNRKSKFQADLAPSDERLLKSLKEDLELASNTDFLSDAVALYRWAVEERRQGHRILSESASGEKKILLFPRLERVAPIVELPQVNIAWTEREVESFSALVAGDAPTPSEALQRVMR